jgi:hypothetical protein
MYKNKELNSEINDIIIDIDNILVLDPIINNKLQNEKLSINNINDRIKNEICYKTINELKDEKLLDDYKKCKSVKNEILKLKNILEKYNIKEKDMIINDYLLQLVPAGTKGVIRGNKFNNIVKDTIISIGLDKNRFEIEFEKQYNNCMSDEIPDWYVLEKSTCKIIIGMNQISIFGGGQQLNRGYKYLVDNKLNTDKSKLLCVICNEINFINNKNKIYKLFEIGYSNDTLCYITGIKNIINNFFNN